MRKIINSLLLGGALMLPNSCIGPDNDSIVESASSLIIEDMDDKIKIYNFIKNDNYDSARLFLENEFSAYLLGASEIKGRLSQSSVLSPDCKIRIINSLDSSINEVKKSLGKNSH